MGYCSHKGVGEPGCPTCDPDKARVINTLRGRLSTLLDALSSVEAEQRVALDAEADLREQLTAMTEAAGNATDERDACEERAEKAEAEVERLRETLANNRTTCAYCEAVHPLPCTFDDIRAHIETCSKHPVAALKAEVERLRGAMEKINAIRNSFVGTQSLSWSEHAYPLVEALNEAGFTGEPYPVARARMGTLLERAKKAEAKAIEAERVLSALADLTHQQAEEWNRERDALKAAHEAALDLAAAHETAAEQAKAEVERLRETLARYEVGPVMRDMRALEARAKKAEAAAERLEATATELARIVHYADCSECHKKLRLGNDCIDAHHVEAREALAAARVAFGYPGGGAL